MKYLLILLLVFCNFPIQAAAESDPSTEFYKRRQELKEERERQIQALVEAKKEYEEYKNGDVIDKYNYHRKQQNLSNEEVVGIFFAIIIGAILFIVFVIAPVFRRTSKVAQTVTTKTKETVSEAKEKIKDMSHSQRLKQMNNETNAAKNLLDNGVLTQEEFQKEIERIKTIYKN